MSSNVDGDAPLFKTSSVQGPQLKLAADRADSRRPVALLLGIERTTKADRYTNNDPTLILDTTKRPDRDAKRIGEMILDGFDVYTASIDKYPGVVQHLDSDFLAPPRRSRFADRLRELLPGGTRLHYILDE